MSKQNSAQKFLSKYLTETAVPALAAASAGTGTAVAIDRALHDDEDHAAFKINIARDFYEGNPRASSAINYIYGPGEFSPMEQRVHAELKLWRFLSTSQVFVATRAPHAPDPPAAHHNRRRPHALQAHLTPCPPRQQSPLRTPCLLALFQTRHASHPNAAARRA